MTLGGLAIAVGLLVDAAIIVTENIVHHLQRRPDGPARDVALHAAQQVGRPIFFATLIVVAVFVPLFAMTGIEGGCTARWRRRSSPRWPRHWCWR